MLISLNGLTLNVEDHCCLESLLEQHFELGPGMAVALNHDVVPAANWAQVRLQPRDRIDVFQAVAGG